MIQTGVFNDEISVGATFTLTFFIQDETGGVITPVDLTGYQARCKFKPNPRSTDFELSATCLVTPLLGQVDVSLLPSQTSTIPDWAESLDYDVELFTPADADVFIPLRGFMTVIPNVTA